MKGGHKNATDDSETRFCEPVFMQIGGQLNFCAAYGKDKSSTPM